MQSVPYGCKGLKDDNLFEGSKEKYNNFVKLIKKPMEDVRVMNTLMMPTKWDEDNADVEAKKLICTERSIYLFY